MRVCLDARKIRDSGIGSYIRGLIRGFSQTGADIHWDFIARSADDSVELLAPQSAQIYPCRAGNYSLSELISISRLANRSAAQLFHAPHYVIPLGLKLPCVVTVHDIIHLKFPQYFSSLQRAYARWMFKRVGRKATAVLTVSECSRKDLIADLHFRADKVFVCYPGVDERYFQQISELERARFRQIYKLPADYLLYVGNLKPHKNVSGLIAAWASLSKSVRPALVIVGERRDEFSSLMRQIHNLGLVQEVFFTGNLLDQMLRAVYQCGCAYVQPSWYEGFGLPPLEAMASAIPVAVSNRGSLPEVSGAGALLFDPAKREEMIAVLEKMLTDEELRTDLISKGLKRAAEFTWKKAAEETFKVYKLAVGKR